MVCIYCGQETRVSNSREQKRANGVWRRRKCLACSAIFTTLERVDYDSSLAFKHGTSHIVPFQREALYLSIYDSCRHRSSATSDAAALTDTVIARIMRDKPAGGIVERSSLVAAVFETLDAFDGAARVHYAAFHPL